MLFKEICKKKINFFKFEKIVSNLQENSGRRNLDLKEANVGTGCQEGNQVTNCSQNLTSPLPQRLQVRVKKLHFSVLPCMFFMPCLRKCSRSLSAGRSSLFQLLCFQSKRREDTFLMLSKTLSDAENMRYFRSLILSLNDQYLKGVFLFYHLSLINDYKDFKCGLLWN